MLKVLRISHHPFYVGCVDPGGDIGLPSRLPFDLGVHPTYAIPRLVMTKEIRAALDSAYSKGSMASTPLGESPLAEDRLNEVLEKILLICKGSVQGKKILEIGCGNGALLNHLKLKGAIVTGLEIGPQAMVVQERYGIRVLTEQLTVGALDEKFDCIYSYGCLEHIDDIKGFFAASRSYLSEGGLFFHSVPNSALSFQHIHLDHLIHEHINYFTPSNGVALLNAQGFGAADFSLTHAGNELMLWGFYESQIEPAWPTERIPEEIEQLKNYAEKLEKKIRQTVEILEKNILAGKSIGFYAGGFEYGISLPGQKFRYFDGDIYKHGKQWLSGLPLIEPPSALVLSPVDLLVICKPHYFDAIRQQLNLLNVNDKSIINIDSLHSVDCCF
jgi:2-polyprenyl-3-methyl-5-hydroxy-6-metoxy-1,4-benzoquinol methylase